MKLIRFGDPGQEKPGVILQDGSRIDTSASGFDYGEDFFENGGLKQLEHPVLRSQSLEILAGRADRRHAVRSRSGVRSPHPTVAPPAR